MPFIGNQPALSYTSFAKQDFTTSATTSYTLDHPVTNENEIALFINFVRQEPTTAYTASGTSLTLTSATSATDDMYCVFLGKAVQTVNPPSGSVGISQLSATGTKDATTFLRGDNTFASAGGTNTPAFYAEGSGTSQTITDATFTKIQISSEVYDTDNAYDPTTNYRFTVPSGQAGKYLFGMGVFVESSVAVSEARIVYNAFYKNDSQYQKSAIDFRNNYGLGASPAFTTTMDLSVGDYVEAYASFDSNGGGTGTVIGGDSFLWGIKLIT